MIADKPTRYILLDSSPKGISTHLFYIELNHDLRNLTKLYYGFLEDLNIKHPDITDLCTIYGKFKTIDLNLMPEPECTRITYALKEKNILYLDQPLPELVNAYLFSKPVNAKLCIEIEYVHFSCEMKKGETLFSQKIDMMNLITM